VCVCERSYNAWFKGWPDLPLLQQGPVQLLKEGVVFDGVLQALGRHAAQPLAGTLGHELDEHTERPEGKESKRIHG